LANIKAVLAAGTSVHGPIAQRNCVACHHIHGGSYFRLLIKEYPPEFYAPFLEETYALCLACHNRQRFLAASTDKLTDFRNGNFNLHFLHINKKVKGRTCRACHETHASSKPSHVRESVPFGEGRWELPIDFFTTETGGGCAPGCHRAYTYDRVDPVIYEKPDEPPTWSPAPHNTEEETRKEADDETQSPGR
jgi:predicted CXXCH cytochrome family protein